MVSLWLLLCLLCFCCWLVIVVICGLLVLVGSVAALFVLTWFRVCFLFGCDLFG